MQGAGFSIYLEYIYVMKKVLVAGAGGFIGGHLVKELISKGNEVVAVDIKEFKDWHQLHPEAKNFSRDLALLNESEKSVHGIDEVYNLAADMGGMGFIEKNKAACMLSVLINTHLLMASRRSKVKKYFFASSACVYNAQKQQHAKSDGLKESDAYPALPEDGYGWEKLFSERMCRHFFEDYGLEVRIGRYHNVYGPFGTWHGGREKAPAAICRKIALAVLSGKEDLEIWGDGNQTRSFTYISDAIQGTLKLMESNFQEPINIGSDQMVTINEMVDLIESYEQVRLSRIYNLDAPLGVRGRNSDNSLILATLNWQPSVKLEEGLRKTYFWIKDELQKEFNINKKY